MTDSPLLDITPPEVRRYITSLSMDTDPHLIKLAMAAKELGVPRVDLSAGQWIELFAAMIGARRVFEFGSAFGYSTYFLARAVGPEGEVHGSEIKDDLVALHDKLFAGHPYAKRITIHRKTGLEALAALDGEFDLIFIDMDKPGYPDALHAAIERVRVGGLILADNVLWSGRTALAPDPPDPDDPKTNALVQFNRLAHKDGRLRTLIMPASDGISVSLRVA